MYVVSTRVNEKGERTERKAVGFPPHPKETIH